MAEVKVPPMLHKMSVSAQKAWYKKNKMTFPGTGSGRSAAKSGDSALIKSLKASQKQKEIKKSSARVQQMAANARAFGGQRPGGDLTTNRGIVDYIRGGGILKAGRLGEENLSELKDTTLKSYLEKRPPPKFKDIARKETVGKPEERAKDIARANLTRIGRMRAKATLLKRNPPPRTTPAVDPNDRGYGQGRYMGDDVNLEGQTMNEGMMKDIVTDREETARLKAQKILGGPVKEKPKMPPGKQPAGYRYVRSLARKAMKRGMMEEVEVTQVIEEIKDQADVGEYDYEGDMAKSQLRSILANAKRMHDMLQDNTNLPEWVQSKITLAQDYVLTAASYMEGEMNEEFTDEEIAALVEASMTDAQMKKREKFVKSMKPVSDWEKRYPGRGEQVMYATATKMAMKEEAEEMIEESPEQIEEKYMGFKALKASIAAKGGVRDPAAVAAAIGRKKYGKEKFQAAAAAGKKMGEEVEQTDEAVRAWVGRERDLAIRRPADQGERDKLAKDVIANRKYNKGKKIGASSGSVRKNASGLTPSQRSTRVTSGGQPINNKELGNKQFAYEEVEVVAEAEGTVAVTPKEKQLAAHHGDPKKITYGDVIKARLKSAAEKAMKKGN